MAVSTKGGGMPSTSGPCANRPEELPLQECNLACLMLVSVAGPFGFS